MVTIKNSKIQVISSAGSLNIGTTVNILLKPEAESAEEIIPPPTIPTPPVPPTTTNITEITELCRLKAHGVECQTYVG